MWNFLMLITGNKFLLPELPTPWLETSVGFADVGARGGPPLNWLNLRGKIQYFCFEPDPDEAAKIHKEFSETKLFEGVVFQKALGAKVGIETLNLTKFRPSSSILEPNMDLLKNIADSAFYEVEKRISIPITTLDSAISSAQTCIDFIKIDTQGFELEVLRGSDNVLNTVIGCELEVSFMEIYKRQPLFADIDAFMRSHGFFLADLERFWWKRNTIPLEFQERGTLAYGNAFYLKSAALTPSDRLAALKGSLICSAMGLDELSWEIVSLAKRNDYLTSTELLEFQSWVKNRRKQTRFWFQMANKLLFLPGRQTLSRWLSLWARALAGHSNANADAQSWNRKTSW